MEHTRTKRTTKQNQKRKMREVTGTIIGYIIYPFLFLLMIPIQIILLIIILLTPKNKKEKGGWE